MGALLKAALRVFAPFLRSTADATGARGVFRESATTTAQTDDVPSAWKGAYVELTARGTYVQWGIVLKGETAPTLVLDQVAALGTGHAAAGKTLLEDTEKTVWIPPNAEKLVWICGTANAGEFFEGNLAGPVKGR
jgi:hypothetical protein